MQICKTQTQTPLMSVTKLNTETTAQNTTHTSMNPHLQTLSISAGFTLCIDQFFVTGNFEAFTFRGKENREQIIS